MRAAGDRPHPARCPGRIRRRLLSQPPAAAGHRAGADRRPVTRHRPVAQDGHDVRRAEPDRVRVQIGAGVLRVALGRDPGAIVLDLPGHLPRPPSHRARHQPGGLLRHGHAAVPGLDRDMRAARQHIVKMAGALVRRRVDDLGSQVVIGAVQRPGQAGLGLDQVEDLADQRAVPVQQVLDPRDMQAGRPGQRVPRVPQRDIAVGTGQRHGIGAGGRHPAVQAVRHRVHRVAGHQPVGGVLAARDHHQSRHRMGDRVLTRQLRGGLGLPGQQRPQAGVHALDVIPGQRDGEDPVDLVEDIVDIGPAGRRVRLVQRPVGVSGADDPVPSPRYDEQDAHRRPQDDPGTRLDPVLGHDQVDPLGRADVNGAAAADHGLDLIGPHPGRVHHLLGADLQFGPRLKVNGTDAGDPLALPQETGHLSP